MNGPNKEWTQIRSGPHGLTHNKFSRNENSAPQVSIKCVFKNILCKKVLFDTQTHCSERFFCKRLNLKWLEVYLKKYRHWKHVRIYGTDVFEVDMLSSISQAS